LTSSQRFADLQRLLGRVVQHGLLADAVELEAGHHVLVDRHRRERVGALEHHADHPPHRGDVDVGVVDVLVVDGEPALDAGVRAAPRACG
jgi:hypothetical protein